MASISWRPAYGDETSRHASSPISRYAVHCGGLPNRRDMSQALIQQYLKQLQGLRKVSGTRRESIVRETLKDLLEFWVHSRDLIFVSNENARKAGLHSSLNDNTIETLANSPSTVKTH